MALEHDKIDNEYKEVEALGKAKDGGIITIDEYNALVFIRTNEIRKLLNLEPVE